MNEVTRGRVRCLGSFTFYLPSDIFNMHPNFGSKQSLGDFYNFTVVKCNSFMIGYNFSAIIMQTWELSLWENSNLQIVLKCHEMFMNFSFTSNSPNPALFFSSYQSTLIISNIPYNLLIFVSVIHPQGQEYLLSSVYIFNWFSTYVALKL